MSANVTGGESETRCLLRGGDEVPTGTHRGESQSGMGKPRESYSAPPVDEVEVAETCQASVGEKHARGVAGTGAGARWAARSCAGARRREAEMVAIASVACWTVTT